MLVSLSQPSAIQPSGWVKDRNVGAEAFHEFSRNAVQGFTELWSSYYGELLYFSGQTIGCNHSCNVISGGPWKISYSVPQSYPPTVVVDSLFFNRAAKNQ